jgi:hypothetical protein
MNLFEVFGEKSPSSQWFIIQQPFFMTNYLKFYINDLVIFLNLKNKIQRILIILEIYQFEMIIFLEQDLNFN